MLRKFIPRAYGNLNGTSDIGFVPNDILHTGFLYPLYDQNVQKTFQLLAEVGQKESEAMCMTEIYQQKLTEMGFPPMLTGVSGAPYDILGDYFRGTMGIFEDLGDKEDYIEEVCWMFADQQIEALQYFKYVDLPVKRVFFPLHKAMDGFMSNAQFERLYWKPLKKIMMALIDMG